MRAENPAELGLHLGCQHRQYERQLPDFGTTVRVMEYDVQDILAACVAGFRELTGASGGPPPPSLPEKAAPDFSDGYTVDRAEVKSAEQAFSRVAELQP